MTKKSKMVDNLALRYVRIYPGVNSRAELVTLAPGLRPPLARGLHSQKRHRLYGSCGFYRPAAICQQLVSSLLTSSSCIKPPCSSQLAASLLTTCNRLVIIKPEQAMRTHPDIGLVIADLLQLLQVLQW